MNCIRIIPVLLLNNGGLYKTVKFKNAKYVGDPINTVKIFNEKQVDELFLLDFRASIEHRQPDYSKIAKIAQEAFMPLGYGGGVKTLEQAQKVFDSGFEKIVLNSAIFHNMRLVEQIGSTYGAQAIACCIDYKQNFFNSVKAYSYSGTKKSSFSPLEWAKRLEGAGVGEILLNNIDRDGTWKGYSLDIISEVAHNVKVPVIACGGAGTMEDFKAAVEAGASAVAASSIFVYQKKGMGVLVSFPLKRIVKHNLIVTIEP